MKHFSAPWGRGLKWASWLATLLCLGIGSSAFFLPSQWHGSTALMFTLLPLIAVPLGAVFFIVRGFAVAPGTLIVHRLLWNTTLSLGTSATAEIVPDALKGSIRIFGNGGLYSFTGRYWSRSLGHYRAFVNDWSTPVVIRYEGKTIVLSTNDPQGMVAALTTPP